MEAAFLNSKIQLASVAQLARPDPVAELELAVDASDHHAGAVLQQGTCHELQPLAFFPKKVQASPAEV